MSERLGRKEKRARRADRIAGVIGVTCLTTLGMFLPAQHSLDSTTATYNAGFTYKPEPEPPVVIEQPAPPPPVSGRLTRDTGIDMPLCPIRKICGTDLMMAFELLPDKDGRVGVAYPTGDTFAVAGPYIQNLPPGADMWRSPTMPVSYDTPEHGKPIDFQRVANVDSNGVAQEVMFNNHRRNGSEITIFPNDGISIPETGQVIMSYMSVGTEITPEQASWGSSYAGLAVSYNNGEYFDRGLGSNNLPESGDPVWMNNHENTDPFQMWSMERDGNYVYIITVRAGRQYGPMMMLRVPYDRVLEKGAYQCWSDNDKGDGWGGDCQQILPDSKYGEPSLRKLDDGTPEGLWVMSYVDYTYTQLMTRTAKNPTGPWSEPKIQMSWRDLNALYGGFIHPKSTPDNLILMVSTWQREIDEEKYGDYGKLLRYDVSHLVTSAE